MKLLPKAGLIATSSSSPGLYPGVLEVPRGLSDGVCHQGKGPHVGRSLPEPGPALQWGREHVSQAQAPLGRDHWASGKLCFPVRPKPWSRLNVLLLWHPKFLSIDGMRGGLHTGYRCSQVFLQFPRAFTVVQINKIAQSFNNKHSTIVFLIPLIVSTRCFFCFGFCFETLRSYGHLAEKYLFLAS